MLFDENQQTPSKDQLHVPVGPIKALHGLLQEIWADSKMEHSKVGPKKDEDIINLIQAIDGAD